jgi:selenocysteine lyase/cysteine desulfurase
MFDLAAVRADTPGCAEHVFLDSAGASLPATPVLEEMFEHLRREAEIGGYRAANERAGDLARGYAVFAELLDCRPEEVAFTDSATRGWLSLLDAVPLRPGDRLLISHVEYASNAIALLGLAERTGASVEIMPSDAHGRIDVDALRELLDERVKLVSLVHVPTNGGLVNPVREVAEAAHAVDALVLLDACQSAGQLPVRVADTGVDLLAGTGRKWLRGPRGTGFLVATNSARERLRPRLVDNLGATWLSPDRVQLRADARVFELWEHGTAARLGLIAAAEYALGLGIDTITAEIGARADRARAGLATIPGVIPRDLGEQRCGLITFTVEGQDSEPVRDALLERNVTVTANYASNTRIDMDERGLESVVRASPHYFVADAQIDEFLTAVADVARRA